MTRATVFALIALLSVACGGTPASDADAHVDTDAHVDIDAADPDGSLLPPDGGDPDGGLCDCCGTTVSSSGGCLGGVCDPWCGIVDPCGGACDFATQVCVVSSADGDAGPPPDGGWSERGSCRPRPTGCDDLANCGGPPPDGVCPLEDPCFGALRCWPTRIARSGNLLYCG